MRRTLILLAPVLMAFGTACDDTGVGKANPGFEPAERVLDFANVCVGDTAEYVLAISNSGLAPLTLTSVTSPNPNVEVVSFPDSLAKNGLTGATGEIVVRWTPEGDGDMTADLVIESDDPASPTTLHLTGHGDAGTRVDLRFLCEGANGLDRCPSFLVFDDTAVGATTEIPVQLTNEGCAELTVSDYYVTDDQGTPLEGAGAPWAVTGPEPGFTFSRRAPQTVTPVFQPAQEGGFFGELHVVWEDRGVGAAPVDERLSLGGNGMDLDLLFDPSSFSFSLAGPGTPQEQRFLIRNLGNLDGTITAFELETASSEFTITPPDGAAPWAIAAKQDLEFFVTYAPTDVGRDSNKVIVRTELGDFELPLVGGSAPRLEIVPRDMVDFGQVTTGGFAMREVTLLNSGSAPLEISDLRFPVNAEQLDGSPVFSLGGQPQMPFEIPVDGQRVITLVFEDNPNQGWVDVPDPALSEQGELAVKSNDPTYAEVPADSGLVAGETSVLLVTETEANFGPERVIIIGSYFDKQGTKQYCDAALCEIVQNQTLTLDGGQTQDPEGDALSYDWTILQSGWDNVGQAQFGNGQTLADVTIKPDYPGPWKFRLTVTDPYGNKQSGDFEVAVKELAAP